MKTPAGFEHERQLWEKGIQSIVGIDEVGRGAWAGPVVAGAVIFPLNFNPTFLLFDSKLLIAKEREELDKKIRDVAQVGIGLVGVPIINKIGIGKATHMAFRQAVRNLPLRPDHFLIDAFYIRHLKKQYQSPLKGGDRICASIAAASIVAKVFRDGIMIELDKKFPDYGFGQHKGYGTKKHQEALKVFSFSPIHRLSFDIKRFAIS